MYKKALFAVGLATVIALGAAQPTFAWHPNGAIVKKVQNQTTGSELSDANDASSAVAAKPGDVLKYVIEVRNDAQPSSNGHNDMHYTVMTDTLPEGVELVSNPAQREIKENLGVLKPGEKVVKEYQVKVTSTTNGALVENKACFTGDSEVKDKPQKGCDTANTKVNVPKEEPKEEEKKEILSTSIEIPATGPGAAIAGALSLGTVGYGVHAYLRAKRELTRAYKR